MWSERLSAVLRENCVRWVQLIGNNSRSNGPRLRFAFMSSGSLVVFDGVNLKANRKYGALPILFISHFVSNVVSSGFLLLISHFLFLISHFLIPLPGLQLLCCCTVHQVHSLGFIAGRYSHTPHACTESCQKLVPCGEGPGAPFHCSIVSLP